MFGNFIMKPEIDSQRLSDHINGLSSILEIAVFDTSTDIHLVDENQRKQRFDFSFFSTFDFLKFT